jgi:hypothetical protein
MSAVVPQYAKSSDPAVLATAERNRAARAAFAAKALAFARQYGTGPDINARVAGWGGAYSIVAIISADKPTAGRWKVGRNGLGWTPFKNNPVHAEMDAITYQPEPIPGLAESYAGEMNPDWSTPVYFPAVFVHDGVAYMSLRGIPASNQDGEPFGSSEFDPDLWTEILPSEWHAAHERATGKVGAA